MRFRKYITEAQRMTLKAAQRKKINKDLTNLTSPKYKTQYFKRIPLKDITDILKKHGIVLLQEDNTEWDGILVGNEATTPFDIAPINSKEGDSYTPYTNAVLQLQWYKMPSDNYEVTCYVT